MRKINYKRAKRDIQEKVQTGRSWLVEAEEETISYDNLTY